MNTPFLYSRKQHFQDWLTRFQGKESFRVPDEVIERIMEKLAEDGVRAENITLALLRRYMRDLEEKKYYNHTAQIFQRMTGMNLSNLDKETEKRAVQILEKGLVEGTDKGTLANSIKNCIGTCEPIPSVFFK